ncbi:hypothetical protein C8Q72DRAFT_750746, partial [Fomitopsis betulina]
LIHIHHSNDQLNIQLIVQPINHLLHSFLDLMFLVCDRWQPGNPELEKFLVFFNNIRDAVHAGQFL